MSGFNSKVNKNNTSFFLYFPDTFKLYFVHLLYFKQIMPPLTTPMLSNLGRAIDQIPDQIDSFLDQSEIQKRLRSKERCVQKSPT